MIKKYLLLFFIIIATGGVLAYLYTFSIKSEKYYISFGASLPLSGINKELGKKVLEGANTYFNHTNAKGGIDGRLIKLIYYDDKYEPQNTLKNIQTLIDKDRVFALFGFVGTPTIKKVLPIIRDTKIPFIAPYTGASFLRNPNFGNIVNFRSSYEQEVEKIVNYLYGTKNIRKFAIFYQNDDFGEEGYVSTIKALKKRGLTLMGEGAYKRNTLSVRHALHEIKSTRPEAIIMVGTYKPSAHFIKKAREKYFDDVIFAPLSFVNANALIDELNGDGKNILFSQVVPPYDNTSLRVTNEYQKLLDFYHPASEPSFASFESFLAAKLVVDALQNTRGALTPKKFLRNLKNLPTDALGEIPIKYNNTQLLNIAYLTIYTDNRFKLVDKQR